MSVDCECPSSDCLHPCMLCRAGYGAETSFRFPPSEPKEFLIRGLRSPPRHHQHYTALPAVISTTQPPPPSLMSARFMRIVKKNMPPQAITH